MRINHFIQIVPKKMKKVKVDLKSEIIRINHPVDIYMEQEIQGYHKYKKEINLESIK